MAAKRKLKVSARKATKSAGAKSASRKPKQKLKLVASNGRASEQKKKQVKKGAAAKVVRPVAKSKAKTKTAASRPKLSEKLLKALEKRKKKDDDGSRLTRLFSKPPSRRGRRPRNPEYNNGNGYDSDYNNSEQDAGKLEYDTGIKVSYAVDNDVPVYERSDDYDEELDFG